MCGIVVALLLINSVRIQLEIANINLNGIFQFVPFVEYSASPFLYPSLSTISTNSMKNPKLRKK